METQEHRTLRLAIEREFGVGINTNLNDMGTASHEELEIFADQLRTKRKRGAGLRALKAKYGHDAAERIVSKHSGRHITLK